MLAEIHRHIYKIIKLLKDFNFGLIIEIIVNIAILYAIFKTLDIFEKSICDKILSNDKNSQVVKIIQILNKILKFVVFFIMFALFLQTHGYSVSSLIAGFGITGLAVGLAANTTLSSIFGTISIITDKSFKIGDYIKVAGYEGTVEAMNMRSTKIRTLDNYLTIIPNSTIANSELVNVSAGHKRRIFETFGVTYDTSNEKLERAVKILEEILESTPEISKDYVVFLETLDSSSINIKVHAYVKTKNVAKFYKEREKFLLAAIKKYREEGIEFAFPSQTVYIAKDQ